MSEDFLKNPLSLFDVSGKTAIVTGATGAFGAMAAKVLAGAGANVVLCANNADELQKVAAECGKLGGKTEVVAKRPSSEANCDAIVAGGGQDVRSRRHPRGRLRDRTRSPRSSTRSRKISSMSWMPTSPNPGSWRERPDGRCSSKVKAARSS